VPDQFDPTEIMRRLEGLWSMLSAQGQGGNSLPRALDRADEVVAALNRLSDEVAKLNENFQRGLPVLESIDQHIQRAMPMVDSLQQAEKGIQALRRTMRRSAPEDRKDPPDRGDPAAPGDGEQ
jgi:hypothetical protein